MGVGLKGGHEAVDAQGENPCADPHNAPVRTHSLQG